MNTQQRIITHQEQRTTHYHLRNGGYGRSLPLTDDQVHELRLRGVPIDLPDTAVLRPLDGEETVQ